MAMREKSKLLNVTAQQIETIERFVANYNAATDSVKVAFRLERLDMLFQKFIETSIEVEMVSGGEESDTDLSERRDEIEEKYYAVRDFLVAQMPTLLPFAPPGTHAPTRTSPSTSVVRLPKINLPEFDGDIHGWIPFRDAYVSLIHSNTNLQPVDKFHYLKAALKNPVSKLLDTITITAANYQIAWDQLISRYDNKRLLLKTHLSALFAIESVRKETSDSLLQLVDKFERHVKILTTMGQPTAQWSSLLVHMVCSRLDKNTLREWEKDTAEMTDEIPTYSDLITFLHEQARILLSLNSGSVAPINSSPASTSTKEKPRSSMAHAATVPASNPSRCPACSQSHRIYECDTFKRMTHAQKEDTVRKGKLCWNCLSSGHVSRDCPSKHHCRRCNNEHHTLLHPPTESPKSPSHGSSPSSAHCSSKNCASPPPPPLASSTPQSCPNTAQVAPTSQQQPGTGTSSTSLSASRSPAAAYSTVLLSTAVVKVHGPQGKTTFARALLDSCSESNFITERIVQLLGLQRTKHLMSICGMGASSAKSTHCTVVTFSSVDSSYSHTLTFHVLPKITNEVPAREINTSRWTIPNDLVLADPDFASPQKIDLVIGAQLFFSLLREGQLSVVDDSAACQPRLQRTVLGWVVSGPVPAEVPNPNSTSASFLAAVDTLDLQLAKFWEIESCSNSPCLSKEELLCEKLFSETTTRDESGRFIVRLPTNTSLLSQLGDSESAARRCLHWMRRRLGQNPELRDQYVSFMQEYIDLGHMVPVDTLQDNTRKHSFFLPHHAVLKPSSTSTKCRVVFNGSSKSSTGTSLNDCLLVGPTVQDTLYSIVLRFRFHEIAIVADITKMYRQIWVHPDDRHLQRIFWQHPTTDSAVRTYELTTVTYGTACAPYLATRCLKQLSHEHSDVNDAAAIVGRDFYVDDLLSGADTINEAVKLRSALQALLDSAGFELRKWASNSSAVLSRIPEQLREVRPIRELDSTADTTIKTLGLVWHPESDTIRFQVPAFSLDCPITKRVAASEMARLFDPTGLVGPVIIKAKMFIQRLWKEGFTWDDPLPSDFCAEWQSYRHDLAALEDIRAPRLVKAPGAAANIELHGFCDASQHAYGACIYIRSIAVNGSIQVRLLTAKSRVAPIQPVSIVRLELCSAHLLSHLFCKVVESVNLPFSNAYFWSDSMVNIHRLRGSPSNYGTFEANRLADIQQRTDGYSWNHVAGLENPADLISRGASPSDLISSPLWWTGPPWLQRDPSEWPTTVDTVDPAPTDVPVVAAVTRSDDPPDHSLYNRYSSLTRLARIAAYCRRFTNHCRLHRAGTPADPAPFLMSSEVAAATLGLVKVVQEECFPTQLELARTGRVQQLKQSWRALDPFYDEGALRVGGRLNHSAYSFARKHPLILPAKHPFTNLLVETVHKRLLHAGPRLMIAHIREQFWPLNIRNLARKLFRSCVKCYRVQPQPASQLMGQLPRVRITKGRAFLHTGVDYCGPVHIKQAKQRARAIPPTRAYIALFVCMATKAVHLELVSDLSTEGFLAALNRFVSRRGRPTSLYCDNATNFVGASKELRTMLRQFVNQQFNERVASFCAESTIELHFIPARAPTFGGLWEAAVRALKHHLRRVVGTEALSFEAMLTVLANIESCLNSRPLTAMSEDPSDLSSLTPGHFLIGSALQSIPEPDLTGFPHNRLSFYQQIQRRTQLFWEVWSTDYLHQLQQRTKDFFRQPNVVIGQLVLLKEDNVPPLKWCMGRITAVRYGTDGLVRVVEVKLPSGAVYDRPVVKVCLLPINDNNQAAIPGSETINSDAEDDNES